MTPRYSEDIGILNFGMMIRIPEGYAAPPVLGVESVVDTVILKFVNDTCITKMGRMLGPGDRYYPLSGFNGDFLGRVYLPPEGERLYWTCMNVEENLPEFGDIYIAKYRLRTSISGYCIQEGAELEYMYTVMRPYRGDGTHDHLQRVFWTLDKKNLRFRLKLEHLRNLLIKV